MVWSRFVTGWDPWREMRRMQGEMDRVFASYDPRGTVDFPPVNVWKDADGVVVTAELPGMDANDLEISVMQDTITLRGDRKFESAGEGTMFHRRERGTGSFVRSLQLPYEVNADKVQARYEEGVLRVELPRAESQKPKRIAVK